MKSILFPTNFTELSLNAFTYAMEYAQKTESKLIIYHSYDSTAEITQETQKVYDKVDIMNFRNKKDTFPPFEKLIKKSKKGDLKIKYIVEEGPFIDNIKGYITRKEDKIDLVILGSQGTQSGLFSLFMETNTLLLLEEISKPVIAVPPRAQFNGSIEKFAFLIDYREDEIEPVREVIQKSKEFNAQLHVVHFDLAHGESIVPQMQRFENALQVAEVENVIFQSIDSINLKKSLESYCVANGIDIICLINHKRNFYQRLFSYSLAEDLLNHLNIPIMAIYQE